MNVSFEGDLIRPLGLVTLYFGYAEFEVDALLDALIGVGLAADGTRNASLGQKLAAVRDGLSRQKIAEADQLIAIVDEGRPLIELRNTLVHSSIVAGGRVRPSDKARSDMTVTPEQLTQLADMIFTWKERLGVTRQLQFIARQSTWQVRVKQDGKGSRGIWIMPLMIVAGKRYVES